MIIDIKQKSTFICFIVFLLSFILCACNIVAQSQNKEKLSLSEAIEIAKGELIKIDSSYWNVALVVKADNNNTEWQKHLYSEQAVTLLKETDSVSTTREGGTCQIKKTIRALKNDAYWAIYFIPKEYNGKGGDAFVFIDRSEGKILGVLLGE